MSNLRKATISIDNRRSLNSDLDSSCGTSVAVEIACSELLQITPKLIGQKFNRTLKLVVNLDAIDTSFSQPLRWETSTLNSLMSSSQTFELAPCHGKLKSAQA